jgi:hypothetical protein
MIDEPLPPVHPPETGALPVEPEEETGLPMLGRWRSVYVFVAVVFFLYTALLTLLTRVYA